MKKSGIFILVFFIFSGGAIFAQADKEEDKTPPGMERVKIGQDYHIVPLGTKVSRRGDLVDLENINEYISRKFYEISQRLENFESEISELKKEINQLKEELAKRQNAPEIPEQKKE